VSGETQRVVGQQEEASVGAASASPARPLPLPTATRTGDICMVYCISVNQSCIFRVVQVIKSLRCPQEAGNNLPGINDNVRERGLEQKCF